MTFGNVTHHFKLNHHQCFSLASTLIKATALFTATVFFPAIVGFQGTVGFKATVSSDVLPFFPAIEFIEEQAGIMAGQDWKIPDRLQEFSKFVPPGWKPGLDDYPFRKFLERLHLWWRITPLSEEEAGPMIASRLIDKPFDIAIK